MRRWIVRASDEATTIEALDRADARRYLKDASAEAIDAIGAALMPVDAEGPR